MNMTPSISLRWLSTLYRWFTREPPAVIAGWSYRRVPKDEAWEDRYLGLGRSEVGTVTKDKK